MNVSREFIYQKLHSNHAINVHMKNSVQRIDNLSEIVYTITELVLDKDSESELVKNLLNQKDTSGILTIKAFRSSETDPTLLCGDIREFTIDIDNIEYIECL